MSKQPKPKRKQAKRGPNEERRITSDPVEALATLLKPTAMPCPKCGMVKRRRMTYVINEGHKTTLTHFCTACEHEWEVVH